MTHWTIEQMQAHPAKFKREVLHGIVDAIKTTKGRNGHYTFSTDDFARFRIGIAGAGFYFGDPWDISYSCDRDPSEQMEWSLNVSCDQGQLGCIMAALEIIAADPIACHERAKKTLPPTWREQMRVEEDSRERERVQKLRSDINLYHSELAKIEAIATELLDKFGRDSGHRGLAFNMPTINKNVFRVENSGDEFRLIVAESVRFGSQYVGVTAFLRKQQAEWTHLNIKDIGETLREIAATAIDPFAVAKRVQMCVLCARELTDPSSRALGYGRDCAAFVRRFVRTLPPTREAPHA